MPSKTTYTKTLRDWELLLSAVAENAGAMPEAEELRAALAQHMTRARELKALQDTAKASRQQRTQDLKAELVGGRDVAMRLRGIAKARIGPKSEQISRFGVAPAPAQAPEPGEEGGAGRRSPSGDAGVGANAGDGKRTERG